MNSNDENPYSDLSFWLQCNRSVWSQIGPFVMFYWTEQYLPGGER